MSERATVTTVTIYYFDSRGRWIAFRENESDKNVFSPTSEWVGWLAWGNDDVCSVKTQRYLGTLVGDRFLKKTVTPVYDTPFTPYEPYQPYEPYKPYEPDLIGLPDGYADV